MSFQIVPLQPEYLQDAAALVATRYQALRQRTPLLPAQYEKVNVLLPMLQELADVPGVATLRSGRLVGFLAGFVISQFLGKRAVYSPEWANGAEMDDVRRIYEEMYAHLSGQWAADGCATHLVTLLAHDRASLEAWQWLGFGLAGVDGLRTLQPVDAAGAQVAVRLAKAEDAAEVTALTQALERHMAAPPTFWPHELEDCAEWVQASNGAIWLAQEGGQTVGCMAVGPANPDACAIIQDKGTASIVLAITHEAARSHGIATRLLNQSLVWAAAQGYERCAVDFEAMNRLAVRFWMRWFEPICYSLQRTIPDQTVGVPATRQG